MLNSPNVFKISDFETEMIGLIIFCRIGFIPQTPLSPAPLRIFIKTVSALSDALCATAMVEISFLPRNISRKTE